MTFRWILPLMGFLVGESFTGVFMFCLWFYLFFVPFLKKVEIRVKNTKDRGDAGGG